MIIRETTWEDSTGAVRQVEVAILDSRWEVGWKAITPLGPFDDPLWECASLREQGRAWWNLHGEQLELWEPPAP